MAIQPAVIPYLPTVGTDEMSDRLEERIRDLVLARPEFDQIVFVARGDPGDHVPVDMHPFGIIFLGNEGDAFPPEGGNETGPVDYARYDGFVTVEVLIPDIEGMIPVDRKINIPSYMACKAMIKGAKKAMLRDWGDGYGNIEGEVVSEDGKERTSQIRVDRAVLGLSNRTGETWSNVATVEYHVTTRKERTSG